MRNMTTPMTSIKLKLELKKLGPCGLRSNDLSRGRRHRLGGLQDYLARQLRRSYVNYDLSRHPPLATLVEEDVRSWDRRFDKIEKRYRDFAGIALGQLQGWDHVRHAQELRNALVHNQGHTRGRTSGPSSPTDRPRTTASRRYRPTTLA